MGQEDTDRYAIQIKKSAARPLRMLRAELLRALDLFGLGGEGAL